MAQKMRTCLWSSSCREGLIRLEACSTGQTRPIRAQARTRADPYILLDLGRRTILDMMRIIVWAARTDSMTRVWMITILATVVNSPTKSTLTILNPSRFLNHNWMWVRTPKATHFRRRRSRTEFRQEWRRSWSKRKRCKRRWKTPARIMGLQIRINNAATKKIAKFSEQITWPYIFKILLKTSLVNSTYFVNISF